MSGALRGEGTRPAPNLALPPPPSCGLCGPQAPARQAHGSLWGTPVGVTGSGLPEPLSPQGPERVPPPSAAAEPEQTPGEPRAGRTQRLPCACRGWKELWLKNDNRCRWP